jgi:glycosidase
MSQYEFHISRKAREKYNFDEALFGLDGKVLIADFAAARRFAEKMSATTGIPVPASDINAMGLIDEILHILVRQYELRNPGVMGRMMTSLEQGLGPALDGTMLKFTEEFPPIAVHQGKVTAQDYLLQSTGGVSHRQTTVEELMLLDIANANPAQQRYKELFDNEELKKATDYKNVIGQLGNFFAQQPGMGFGGQTLIDLLTAPAKASPTSLQGQLEYLLNQWGSVLGESFVLRILRGIDFAKEEIIRGNFAGGFAGGAPVLTFTGHDYTEYERFSPDKDWMPRCVLIAKNTYVWLEQLSRKYGFWVRTLDLIPDEELDILAQRGFTGLWLIGLWERSQASQKMKQMMGDPDAVASAYSLMRYDIATDLGGWDALQNLRARAWKRGIRLSADMVPNHMGIDSQWVVEHPDWFLSLPYAPYPSYSFNGPDLSNDSRVNISIEDHYYTKSDAAVVFKRVDRWSSDTRFIYHGNDGTSMPWNDTAQLDYAKAEVREAVIQTILHVARNFPIIRFDAAMTLAKKHIQRLWFPEPGAGGAIPSRSEHGMTQTEFDAAMPEEFWREVVNRVAAEVPDTLLLAEAFWLMEGYFVRTLGMHRVYNSAFMHMMRDEDNAKYRDVMKNVLEFDPQVLKRFVNFMNNPDEKTAVEQFGDGDKYFGVCTLLATLPGLPMFGHGQVEGFHEKYGMEFRRPKWDEALNDGLIKGHEWRIFPLLHLRRVFTDVENFLLYDFYTLEGHVNEDIFAHSNRFGDPSIGSGQCERGLVVYHNKYAETRGWIKTSAAFMDKSSGNLVQKTLADGLALPNDGYAIFKDYVTHIEYIRSCGELVEKGLYVELGGYQCHAFLDWRFVSGEQWAQVCNALNGAGVPSMQAKFDEMFVMKEEVVIEKEITKKKKAKTAKPKAKKAVAKSAVKKSTVSKKTTTVSVKKSAAKPKAKPAAKPAATSSPRSARRVKGKKHAAKVTKPVAKKAAKKTTVKPAVKKAVKKPTGKPTTKLVSTKK